MKAKLVAGLAIALAQACALPVTFAEEFPTRPISIIVPYTPGDGSDVTARLIGDKISKSLGQPVVVENKGGASGQLGLSLTARAKPDGYTLGVGLVTNLALAPCSSGAGSRLQYDPLYVHEMNESFAGDRHT